MCCFIWRYTNNIMSADSMRDVYINSVAIGSTSIVLRYAYVIGQF